MWPCTTACRFVATTRPFNGAACARIRPCPWDSTWASREISRVTPRSILAVRARARATVLDGPIPVIQPRITVITSIQDSTATGALLPNDAGISPNGKLLAYSTRGDLRLINTSTGAARVIFEGNVHTFMWAAGSDALGMTHDDPKTGSRDIFVLHLDPHTGVPAGPAVKAALGPVNHGASLSPDESLIAFARPIWDKTRATWSDRAELVVAPANGGPVRVLAAAQDLRVHWAPDGQTIYYNGFADESNKKRQIFRVPVQGGQPSIVRELTNDPWPSRLDPVTRRVTAAYAVPPDMSMTDWSGTNPLAGVRVTHPRGLRVIHTADGTARDLIDLTAEVGVPEWFSNGNRLAVIARRNDKLVLLTLNADGTQERSYAFTVAPYFEGVGSQSNAHLQVSPDGKFAAFLGESRETIELLDLRNGSQRTLVKVQADGAAPDGLPIGQLLWSDDSKSIRYLNAIRMPARRAVREVTLGGVDRLVLALPASLCERPEWY